MSKHLAMKVQCPECGTIYTVPQGTPDVDCNCHLICSEGETVKDCTVTVYNHTSQKGWPEGVRLKHEDESDDLQHATGYCSTHNRYIHKQKIIIECNWALWYSRRAPRKFRSSHGEY